MLNAYEINGRVYEAQNEYDAVKKAYKMANSVSMQKYIGNEVWLYVAKFSHGKAEVIVRRVRRLPIENEKTNKTNMEGIMKYTGKAQNKITGHEWTTKACDSYEAGAMAASLGSAWACGIATKMANTRKNRGCQHVELGRWKHKTIKGGRPCL